MATATLERPAESKEAAPDRIFKTVKGQVGPYPHRHVRGADGVRKEVPFVFSESQFVRDHPISNPLGPDRRPLKENPLIDAATYHKECLQSLLDIGAIIEAPGETPMPTPNRPAVGTKNFGVSAATESIVAAQTAFEEQKKRDMARIREAPKP